jgi:hypothetical protein
MPTAKPTPGTLRADLDLALLLGSTWAGFTLHAGDVGNHNQGTFTHSHWRRAFTAGELVALFYRCQLVNVLEVELRQMRREIERADLRAIEAETAAAFYRRELRGASRFGLMFQPAAVPRLDDDGAGFGVIFN